MKKTENMPAWVFIALLGINSRLAAYSYAVISVLLGIASVAYGFVEPVYFNGGVLILAAGWYICAVAWVDKHASWKVTAAEEKP